MLEEHCPILKVVPLKLCSLTQQPPGGISFHILQTSHSIPPQEKHPRQHGNSSASSPPPEHGKAHEAIEDCF
uniref:Uncharacterized protein n=1 Tax=Arundo donax TaxID=35708 RepID=A0A0A8ZQQ0_ARUDO